jgi:hypothetical protein
MPTLMLTCSELRAGLQRARIANQTKQEISAIQERLREWNQRASTRCSLVEKVRFVDLAILQRDDVHQADIGVFSLAVEAKRRLQAGGDVQTLAIDNLWARLIGAADTANGLVQDAARSTWRQFVDNLGRVENPAVLESRVLTTPANARLLAEYKVSYLKYQSAVRTDLPLTATTASEIAEVVATLRAIQEQMRSEAPEHVTRFLKAVESGGAALELVTSEVITWLRENDDPNRFVVKVKGA